MSAASSRNRLTRAAVKRLARDSLGIQQQALRKTRQGFATHTRERPVHH